MLSKIEFIIPIQAIKKPSQTHSSSSLYQQSLIQSQTGSSFNSSGSWSTTYHVFIGGPAMIKIMIAGAPCIYFSFRTFSAGYGHM